MGSNDEGGKNSRTLIILLYGVEEWVNRYLPTEGKIKIFKNHDLTNYATRNGKLETRAETKKTKQRLRVTYRHESTKIDTKTTLKRRQTNESNSAT